MTDETDIPIPVRFNPFKHHRNYILGILDSASPEMIISLLDPVCNNYIDIYTGSMTPDAISNAIIDRLKMQQVFDVAAFSHWVDSKNGFRQIKLEDQSEWVVRRSVETERYIHLHPAHTGLYTIRFKGSTLKTAYLLKSIFKEDKETFSLEKVNRVRIQIGLSPVKKLDRSKGILNCLWKFFYPEKFEESISELLKSQPDELDSDKS